MDAFERFMSLSEYLSLSKLIDDPFFEDDKEFKAR